MTHHHFSASDYERMIAAGILTEDDRVELIAGEIIKMSPVSDRHVGCVNMLADLLADINRREMIISIQNPIRLSDDSQPQPDFALVRRQSLTHAVPVAVDVLLVIEVADSSRDYDRKAKLPRYASAGIPEAWLVDLTNEVIERYTEPRSGYYRVATFAKRGDTLASTVLPALTIPVDLVLGEAEE